MYYPSPEYFKQLQARFQQMEEAIAELQSELAAMESENKQIRKKMEDIKPIHIENLNYKIQELAVQELKGTLNIGMTALSDAEEIQKMIRESETGESIQLHDMETADPNESEPDISESEHDINVPEPDDPNSSSKDGSNEQP